MIKGKARDATCSGPTRAKHDPENESTKRGEAGGLAKQSLWGRSLSLKTALTGLVAVLAIPPGVHAEQITHTATSAIKTSEPAAASESETISNQETWDPWAGIERDGRIPGIEKDVPNPERWRYIPEGRIKPGNVLQRFLVSSFIAPFIFRDSDVGLGGGIAITDIDFRQQRRREFFGAFLSYTTEGQQAYTAVWNRALYVKDNPGGGVIQEERSRLRAIGGYRKSLTLRFFGLGNNTKKSDESSYLDENAFGGVGIELAVPDPGDDLVVGAGIRGEWHDLGPGRVGGRPTTGDAFPLLFREAQHQSLGWLTTEIRWNTRDSERQTYRGWDLGAVIDSALIQTNGNVGATFSVDGSAFVPVPGLFHDGGDGNEENPPTDTLAFHLETSTTAGELPFFALPTLGGRRTLRGYIAGRWRDRSLWTASAEYRFWVLPRGFAMSPWTPTVRVERLGLALFYDVGAVADDWWQIFRNSPHHCVGVGLRIALERVAPFRIDVGFSREDVQLSAGFGLPF